MPVSQYSSQSSKSTITQRGTCLPAPVSEKNLRPARHGWLIRAGYRTTTGAFKHVNVRAVEIVAAGLPSSERTCTHIIPIEPMNPKRIPKYYQYRGMSGTYLRFCFSCCGFILSNSFFWKECIPETPCFIIIFPVKMKKCSCGDKSPTFFDTTTLPGVNPHQETCWMHRPRHLWKQQKRYVVWRCQLTQWLGRNSDVLLGKMFSLF